jgi:hypothetical protein
MPDAIVEGDQEPDSRRGVKRLTEMSSWKALEVQFVLRTTDDRCRIATPGSPDTAGEGDQVRNSCRVNHGSDWAPKRTA